MELKTHLRGKMQPPFCEAYGNVRYRMSRQPVTLHLKRAKIVSFSYHKCCFTEGYPDFHLRSIFVTF